eukprot:51950-Eustigmatos_ZCMA.PRE.1
MSSSGFNTCTHHSAPELVGSNCADRVWKSKTVLTIDSSLTLGVASARKKKVSPVRVTSGSHENPEQHAQEKTLP